MNAPHPPADAPVGDRLAHPARREGEREAEHSGPAGIAHLTPEEHAPGLEIALYSSPVVGLAVRARPRRGGVTLADVGRLTGVHAQLIRYYCRLGLLAPSPGSGVDPLIFDASVVEDLRRIEHYRCTLGVKRRALTLMCELRREAARQDLELEFLETTWGKS
jgi:hypothetical protein